MSDPHGPFDLSWFGPIASLLTGALGAWVAFRLQVERFFGKDAEREKHHDQRHAEVLRRLDRIEAALHHHRRRDDFGE